MTLLLAATAAAVMPYTVTDLGTLGGAWSKAYGINDVGQVVGQSRTTSAYSDAFLWEDGLMQDLSAPPDNRANDINNHGRIVGWAVGSGQRHSMYWEYGEEHRLGISAAQNEAHDVNECDQIVGLVRTDSGDYHAYLWEDWAWQDLGTLGGSASAAYGINDDCLIVGEADVLGDSAHAFIWQAGAMTDLGTLGGAESCAQAINSLGDAVGWADTASQYPHAFVWQNATMSDLGTLEGDWSRAYGVNDVGQIVGGADVAGHWPGHAFLWEDGMIYDLNDLMLPGSGWVLEVATDINDAGQIVGYGVNPDGQERAFLLTPIPEPGALALAALGALGLLLRRGADG